MSYYDYIAFPNELNAVRLSEAKGKEKEYGINYDISDYRNQYMFLFPDLSPMESNIIIVDKKEATFRDCFKNKFIYYFCVDLRCRRWNIAKNLDEESKENLANEHWLEYQKVQYNFIFKNLNSGEFAEIYTVRTDHVNFDFGPPKIEYTMTLDEFLNMPRPDKIVERQKITLFK